MTTLAPTVEQQLERLAEQVEALRVELSDQRRDRNRWSELGSDLSPVAEAALERLSAEMQDSGLTNEDLVGLLRALATTLPDLTAAIGQVAAVADLARTAAPITGPALETLTSRVAELESRGYFDFARGGAGVIDKVVTAFGDADIEALGDNVVLILNTVKEMTQPEVMQMLQRTMHTVQDSEPVEPPSLFGILRELRDPEVRLGLHRILTALRSVGAAAPAGGAPSQTRKED